MLLTHLARSRISRPAAFASCANSCWPSPPPWFEYKVSEDIHQTTQGEAYIFSQKLLAAGQTAKIVGRIGHLLPMVALPPATPGALTEVRYGWQFLQ